MAVRYSVPMSRLAILDDSDIEQIHDEALNLLETVGVQAQNSRLVSLLRQAGAHTDEQSCTVKFPRAIIEEALRMAPSEFSLYDRSGTEYKLSGSGQSKYMGMYGSALKILDHGATRFRSTVLRDAGKFMMIADSYPELAWVTPPCHPYDARQELANLLVAQSVLSNSRKMTIICPHNMEDLRDWLTMGSIASDSDGLSLPHQLYGISTTSPLLMDNDSCQMLLCLAEQGQPIMTTSCPMGGGTSPSTLAGTMLLQNVETLFILTAVQLIRQGCPVVLGGAAATMDLRKAYVSYGSPERSLMLTGHMQLAHFYNIPGYSPSGSVDSCQCDVQIGVEKTLIFMSRLLSHATFLGNMGAVANGLAISLEQAVIDMEIMRFLQRFLDGVNINEVTLATEAIARVGIGGDYMMDDHTLQFARSSEHFYPQLFNRDGDNGRCMLERAHDEVNRILEEHVCPVPEGIREKLSEYVRDREESLTAS